MKSTRSLLRFHTNLGDRFVRLSFRERISFAWIFRHFSVVPLNVLHPEELGMVEELRRRANTESEPHSSTEYVIGTIDCTYMKKPMATEVAAHPSRPRIEIVGRGQRSSIS